MFGAKPSLSVGDSVPDVALTDQHGNTVTLSAFRGRPVVVYFYPKDETPVCVAESCSFRDHYEDFQTAGAEVIGISADSQDSHSRFAAHHRLPFVLLADPDGAARRAFGVEKTLGVLPGRVTFVVDPDGVVRHRFSSLTNVRRHVQDALSIVRELAS